MCRFLSRPRSAGWSEAQEAMSTASQVFEEVLDTFTTGKAGVLVRPSEDQDAVQAKAELERALAHLSSSEARWDIVVDDSEHPSSLDHRARLRAVLTGKLDAHHRGNSGGDGHRSSRARGGLSVQVEGAGHLLDLPAAYQGVHTIRPGTGKRAGDPATIPWNCGWSRHRGRTSPPHAPSRSGIPSGGCPSNRSRCRVRARRASACAAPRGSAPRPAPATGPTLPTKARA